MTFCALQIELTGFPERVNEKREGEKEKSKNASKVFFFLFFLPEQVQKNGLVINCGGEAADEAGLREEGQIRTLV